MMANQLPLLQAGFAREQVQLSVQGVDAQNAEKIGGLNQELEKVRVKAEDALTVGAKSASGPEQPGPLLATLR